MRLPRRSWRRAVLVFIRPEEVTELPRHSLPSRLGEHLRVDFLDVLAEGERQFCRSGRRREPPEPEADAGCRRYRRRGEEFDDGAR